MFRRVLVTGGAGFIGSHMVDLLLENGYQVRVLDNLEPQVHGPVDGPPGYLNREAEFIRGDILDRETLLKALDGMDAVIHDAAMVGVGQSQYQIQRYVNVNATGTANLLDCIVNDRRNVQRLLVASSMSIYGEGAYRRPGDGTLCYPTLRPDAQLAARDFEMHDPDTGEVLEPIPTSESKPLYCTSVYAQSKKDQEEYTLIAGRAHGLSVVAARYFNVYGPRQALSNPYTGAAAIFASRIKNGNPPLIYEDGLQSRDFISVRDVVAAKLVLLESDRAELDTFNICTGKPTTILAMAELLCRLHGREDLEPDIRRSFRSGDIRHCYGNPTKIHSLGWKAKTELESGMADLVEWTLQQTAKDNVEEVHRELVQRGLVKE